MLQINRIRYKWRLSIILMLGIYISNVLITLITFELFKNIGREKSMCKKRKENKVGSSYKQTESVNLCLRYCV